ncbi:YdgA family protein [Pseudomonas sp. S75]|uniref:YdgA family protein n=1 Tax=unclassified Pseudomonas TaxID=196821 RepID=UPI001903AE4C|nr:MULTISPECIES: YdgA family protein [unclassified Pseudomonas]MBJ9975527.1 YdgA family protein [Pseudomonas sp. S30]MBK0153078.1 YdgA family protein [Pseudomonas sp. S75]
MKKSVGILSGLAVAIAVVTIAGAWYTGKQLPAELEQSIARGNAELQKALVGTGGTMTIELVSLDQHLFTSEAKYRLKARDLRLSQGEPVSFEVGVDDHIEHGPFPWSRVKTLKLLPVMAVSNSRLQKDDTTADWFAAAGDKTPVTGQVTLGYAGGVQSDIALAPVKLDEGDGNLMDFGGMQLLLKGDKEGKSLDIHGEAPRLDMTLVGDDHPPIKLQANGFRIGGKLDSTAHDMIYVGHLDLYLADLQATLGPKQDVLLLKGLEQNSVYSAEGQDRVGGRLEYKVSDITYAGRQVGSGQMVMSMKSINMAAAQALADWYQAKAPQMQAAAAQGQQGLPALDMTPEEKAMVQTHLQKLLADKPQFALEDLSFKTANGQSRFNMTMDFANPASFDLPPDQLMKQLIARLQSKLTVSKAMVGDLTTLQALLDGQSDPQAIAQQSSQAGEMLGVMALQSGMATVEGNDVVSSLNYADGMVELNGRKMPVEDFVMMMSAQLAVLSPQG